MNRKVPETPWHYIRFDCSDRASPTPQQTVWEMLVVKFMTFPIVCRWSRNPSIKGRIILPLDPSTADYIYLVCLFDICLSTNEAKSLVHLFRWLY